MKAGIAAISSALALLSCGNAGSITQANLDAISDKCGLKRSALTLVGADELRFQPSANESYDAVACALDAIAKVKYPNVKMGFIGNEQFAPEAK
jgi:hypothetical protein